MMNIDIAIGKSRREVNWKNTEMSWADFVDRLRETHRTAETLGEYLKAKKVRQDEIKDIGGFVGGYLSAGRRKTENVAHRSIITLDLDFATPTAWEDFTMLYDCAACLYSTHKHSPDNPRLRLVILLDREVFSDEYVAISRKVAGVLGIDMFDHTTFEPARLMYWPSTAKDGVYEFREQVGQPLNADGVLAMYRNWKDSSEWPTGRGQDEAIARGIKKQGDPLEKPGIIGAFCRSYGIAEVIEKYLGDVYEPSGVEGRYTFKGGSTGAGLVVYQDKWAYSHHGTDPVSGKLCNAFDLVRLHLYGLRDEESREGTPGNKLPSFVAMTDKAMEDKAVRALVGREKLAEARESFSDIMVGPGGLEGEGIGGPDGAPGEVGDAGVLGDNWLEGLEVDKRGNYVKSTNNIILILQNDPNLRGKFTSNAFTRKDMVIGNVPWRDVEGDTGYFTDLDMMGLRDYLEKIYGIVANQKVMDAMGLVLYGCRYHPVREYLQRQRWDGVERVDTLLVDYLGAEDSDYVRAVTRKTLCAAVARIMKPGVKFDYVLTLVGRQGAGKSTLIKKLGREWYCENLTTVQGKEAAEQLQGVWLMEMGELAGLKKAEVEIIKNFISRQEDSYRPSYGIRKETYLRQCIFIGTTNNREFLRDPTGNRRFWPVMLRVGGVDKETGEVVRGRLDVHRDLSEGVVGQIWAEAVQRWRAGERLYLDEQVEDRAKGVQEAHAEVDDRGGMVERFLETLLPVKWPEMSIMDRRSFLLGDETWGEGTMKRNAVCVAEIWCECFGKHLADMTTFNTKSLHIIMQKMGGWEQINSVRKYRNYGRQRTYTRVNSEVNKEVDE